MSDQYDWGLWFGDEAYQLPHSYVYYRDISLEAHRTYHFLTRNLRPVTSANPDPVMYLVRGNDIVAFNDDYTGYASEIIYTPTVTGSHRLVIRAFTTSTAGVCDVYQGVDGAPPVLLESNVPFAGTYVWVRWKLGEWFETGAVRDVVVDLGGDPFTGTITGGGHSDPYLFLIYPESAVGSKMFWDDDGAGSLQSKIEPPTGGTGTVAGFPHSNIEHPTGGTGAVAGLPHSKIEPPSTGAVILGAYSRYTGGQCRLALVGQSYKAPWMSPAPWAYGDAEVPRPASVTRYMEELERQKPALDELSPDERDQRVLELQRRLLSEEEIRRQVPPMPAVSAELVRRQELFSERYSKLEEDLARMSYDERAAQLAQVKRESMGREYSEPEASLLPEGRQESS